jgi:hypothetical protein
MGRERVGGSIDSRFRFVRKEFAPMDRPRFCRLEWTLALIALMATISAGCNSARRQVPPPINYAPGTMPEPMTPGAVSSLPTIPQVGGDYSGTRGNSATTSATVPYGAPASAPFSISPAPAGSPLPTPYDASVPGMPMIGGGS